MVKLRVRQQESFLRGGIFVEAHKAQSTQEPCTFTDTPKELIFPIHFSGGGPGKILIKIGQAVAQGTPIIECKSGILHAASRAGHITSIEPRRVIHNSQALSPCIVLKTDGSNRQENDLTPISLPLDISEIKERARAAGILGLGGAGFPSHKKWEEKVHTLIINGAECEPYLTADDTVMQIDTHSMIQGACVLASALNVKTIVIGIEDNKPAALHQIKKTILDSQADHSFEIVVIETKYPSGGERQLVWLTLGVELPSGLRPVDLGILVHNPGTLAALARALDGKPTTDRIITITGEYIGRPRNVIAPIGTPIRHLLTSAEAKFDCITDITVGGPMMGFNSTALDAGITKMSNCLLANSIKKYSIDPCIRCGYCAVACPVQLQPQQLYLALSNDNLERAQHEGLDDCIECAACNNVCPSHIPLAEWFRLGRFQNREATRNKQVAASARIRFEARTMRLDRLAQEDASKRAARREQTTDALVKARKLREKNTP